MSRKQSTLAAALAGKAKAAGAELEAPAPEPAFGPTPEHKAKGGLEEGKTTGGLVRISTYVPSAVHARLEAIAKKRGLTISAVTKNALAEWLEGRERD